MRIITGKIYSGKTSHMLKEVGQRSGHSLVLVPELFSHNYERLLAEKTDNTGAGKGEILTFRRLMNRVFAQAGGLAHTSLTEAGRLLYGYEAARRAEAGLTLYRGLTEKTDTLKEVLQILDECKCWSVTPSMLLEAADFAQGTLQEKLKDLGQIFLAYDRLCQGQDPREDMNHLAEKIPACSLFQGTALYFDGFSGFTAQEMAVIEALMGQKADLTFLFDLDPDQWDIFYGTRKTIYRLEEMAKSHGISVEKITKKPEKEESTKSLRYLASHLLDSSAGESIPADSSVGLVCCGTILEECEQAAGQIRKAVQNGARYRDFVLAARDFTPYRAAAEMIFQRYEIPVFLSEKTDIMEKPVMLLVTASLEAVSQGYRYEDMFAYLKTGLTSVSREDCDRLENYVWMRRIQGGKWLQEWKQSPRRFAGALTKEDQQQLEQLNEIRIQVIEPLQRLKEKMTAAQKGLGYVQAFYDFLLEIQADQVIEKLAEEKEKKGRLQQGAEYRQLWDILIQAMEQFALTEGEQEMQLKEFAQLFTLLLSQYDVATIPVSMDRVTCGSIERVCSAGVEHLILLGVNDGILPRTEESSGIFTDRDREELIGLGIELSGTAEEKIWMEQEAIYRAVACPKKSLTFSYHQYGTDGGEVRPSMLILTAKKLLTGLTVEKEKDSALTAPRPCLDAACSYLGGQKDAVTQAAYHYYRHKQAFEKIEKQSAGKRGPLASRETVEKLYGRHLQMTASRADRFYSCRFAFFMEYGLRAKKREVLTMDAPAMGTFLHDVLEHTIAQCMTQADGDPKGISREMMEAAAQENIQRYIEEELGGLSDKSARFRFLLERMVTMLGDILQNVLEEMQDSDFVPLDFELEFSAKGQMEPVTLPLDDDTQLRLTGKVDRVDGYVSGDRLYLRVVDYKSGKKTFSLSDLWNGMNLQLFIYLFALQQKGLYRYQNKLDGSLKKIVPAGALYVPVREPVVEADSGADWQEIQKQQDKQRVRAGLLLENMAVLEAMSHHLQDGSRFLPVSLKKDGTFKAGAPLASLEQMGQLARHIEEKLQEMGRLILAGDVQANPYYENRQTHACQWCPYHAACQFDERNPEDQRRYLLHMEPAEFWEKMGGKSNGQTMDDRSADGDL